MLLHRIISYSFCILMTCFSQIEAYSFEKLTIFTSGYMGGGPGAVVRSYFDGLKKNNVPFNYNPHDNTQIGEVVHVVSDTHKLAQAIELKKAGKIKLLVAGPNLMTLPSEYGRILLSPEIDLVLVNSEWTRVAYSEQEPSLADHIDIWYAGVDESNWIPKKHNDLNQNNVLVYWKTESESFCTEIESVLRCGGYSPIRLRYGYHSHEEYKKLLQEVRFAVFISCSESQGIALAEAWAMDVPTINWDPEALEAHGRVYSQCSSCPYLSPATGLRWKTMDQFREILKNLNLNQFSPRAWVLQHMTDEISVRLLMDMIEKKLTE